MTDDLLQNGVPWEPGLLAFVIMLGIIFIEFTLPTICPASGEPKHA